MEIQFIRRRLLWLQILTKMRSDEYVRNPRQNETISDVPNRKFRWLVRFCHLAKANELDKFYLIEVIVVERWKNREF